MFSPCYEHCFVRLGKQYTTACDDVCEYAKAIKERDALKKNIQEFVEDMETSVCTGEYPSGQDYKYIPEEYYRESLKILQRHEEGVQSDDVE